MNTVTRIIQTAGAIVLMATAAVAQRPVSFPPEVVIDTTPPSPARSPAAVVERLLSFDANKDHRITRDELPDRMQPLIARWDKNADAALDVEELRTAVFVASSDRTRVAFRVQPSDGLAGVINDLKLSPEKREQALAILSAHKPAQNITDAADGDLYKALRSLLDDEEYENFAAAAARLSKTAQVRVSTFGGKVLPLPPPPTVR